jgi:ribonuclease-3
LQHYAQEHLAATPVYRETSSGTPQEPAFASKVVVKGKTLGTGSGPSKKAAQQAAAEAALVKLRTQHT